MKIDFSSFWDKYPEELTVAECAEKAVEVLKQHKDFVHNNFPNYEDDFDEIIDEFESITESDDPDIDDFNYVMDDLYDWGDISLDSDKIFGRKLCWVNK
jgi:hypothetical protein